jgi:hypothetical protein
LENLKRINNFVSFIHTKRYITFSPYEKDFSNIRIDEYDQIFDVLLRKEISESNINVVSFIKENNSDIVTFNLNDEYNDNFRVSICSLFRPCKDYTYFMNLCPGVNFFVAKETDVWTKDTHMIIENNRIIKDLVKLT